MCCSIAAIALYGICAKSISRSDSFILATYLKYINPLNTRSKLNVHKIVIRRPGRPWTVFMYVQFRFWEVLGWVSQVRLVQSGQIETLLLHYPFLESPAVLNPTPRISHTASIPLIGHFFVWYTQEKKILFSKPKQKTVNSLPRLLPVTAFLFVESKCLNPHPPWLSQKQPPEVFCNKRFS